MRTYILLLGSILIYLCSCQGNNEQKSAKKFFVKKFKESGYNQESINTLINKADFDSVMGYSARSHEPITLLGTGYNSITGELLAPGIVSFKTILDDSAFGIEHQKLVAYWRRNYSEVTETMNVSGGASLGFSAFSGSAKLETLNSLHSSYSNDYLIVKVFVKHYSRELKSFELDTSALEELNDYGTFLAYGGDRFIYRETYGGELYIIFSAEAYSKAEKSSNSKSFGLAAKFLNLGGSANIKNAKEQIEKTENVSLYLYQNGGIGFDADSATIDSLIKYSLNFPKQVRSHSTLISFDVKDYNLVKGFPKDYYSNNTVKRSLYYMDSIVSKLLLLNAISGDVQFVGRNSGIWGSNFSDSIMLLNPLLGRRIKELQRCANECKSLYSVTNCSNCAALHEKDTVYRLELP